MKYIGIDIGGTNIRAGIVEKKDGTYTVLAKEKCTTAVKHGVEGIYKRIKDLYDKLLEKTETSVTDINWVGIAVPGAVNVKEGIVGFSPNITSEKWKIRDDVEELLKKKVVILNDADAYAYGEYIAGSARKSDNTIVLTLGTGVGCGIILNGKIYSSKNFASGEVGHMVIQIDGRKCNCGRKGCLEAYASATGLVKTTIEEVKRSDNPENEYIYKITNGLRKISARTPFDAKKAGDPLGKKIIDIYVKQLGTGIANLVNILQPEKVCIGGGVSLEDEYLLEPLRNYVNKEKFKTVPNKDVKIVRALNYDTAGIIGAVAAGEKNILGKEGGVLECRKRR